MNVPKHSDENEARRKNKLHTVDLRKKFGRRRPVLRHEMRHLDGVTDPRRAACRAFMAAVAVQISIDVRAR